MRLPPSARPTAAQADIDKVVEYVRLQQSLTPDETISINRIKQGAHLSREGTTNALNAAVEHLARQWAGGNPLEGPVAVKAHFIFSRPKAHFGTASTFVEVWSL